MILQNTIDCVEKIGGGESSKFQIKISRKAFQILSDLYSDKALAIVRELGCNAFDSHVSAGKASVPFAIHLPNSLEPYLEIRDFGTGMSHEDVKSIYTTYFESTKSNSNDAIGCLGLGSKSFFCYTDSGTITVRHNGVKRLYLAYFDEGGAPTITLAGEEANDEGNGVAIQIPVKKEDCDKFRQAAMTAFKWFPVKPDISGAKIDWSETEQSVTISGKGWRVLESKISYGWRSNYDTNCYAVMGGVNYAIDSNKVNSDVRAILSNLVVEFPIGDLDFTPSREALSYDDRTVANLNSRLAEVKAEISKKAIDEMSKATYLNEAARIWSNLPDFVRQAIGKFYWQNKKIDGIAAPHREYGKRSYSKNFHVSNRDYVHVPELARLKGISFTLERKTSVWKVKEFILDSGNSNNSALIFDEVARKKLIDAGVDPACFACTSSLPYTKSAVGSAQRQIDKEIVGIADSHYLRFDSINLRTAINDGAKYYAIKNENNAAIIKGKAISKYDIRHNILKSPELRKTCVFVAPTKEKLAISAGLTHVDSYIDSLASVLNSKEGQEYLAIKEAAKKLLYASGFEKKFILIAEKAKSNLAQHVVASIKRHKLADKFSGLEYLANLYSIKASSVAVQLPELSALEEYLFDEMNNYSGPSEKVYAAYEAMFEKNPQNNPQIPLTSGSK